MNDQNGDATSEISLFDLYHVIRRNILLILFFTAIFFAAATYYAYVIADTKYKSNADVMIQVVVNPDTETYDYATAQRLIATIAELMRKDIIINHAIGNLDTDLSATAIRSDLTITSSNTSFFINIAYVSEDPAFAKEVVNEIINSAILITGTDASFSSLANKITRTSFADDGLFDSPNRMLYMAIGVLLGGIVGLGITFIREYFKNTYTNKEQIEAALGIQVLGVIPKFDGKKARRHENKQ